MVTLTDEQREQIQILESFLEQGLMDPEDFEEEKKKILSGGSIAEEDEDDSPIVTSSKFGNTQSKPSTSVANNNNNSSSTTTTTTPTTTTQRKHIVKEDSSSDDEPVIKSSSSHSRGIGVKSSPVVVVKTSTNNKPTVVKSSNSNSNTPSRTVNTHSKLSDYDTSESNDDENEAVAVVSGNDDTTSSDHDRDFMKNIGGGRVVATGRKILQNSSTEDEESGDGDSQDEIISKIGRNAMVTSSVKKNEKSGYQLNLTAQERQVLSAEQIQQLEKMAHLVDSEILSEDELLSKKENLVRQQLRKIEEEKKKEEERKRQEKATVVTKSINTAKTSVSNVQDQLKKLEDLFNAGILTEEEYRAKKRQLVPEESSEDEEDEDEDEDDDEDDEEKGLKLKLTPLQRDQLSKLDSLLEMGILDNDEYEEKKRQVMGLKNEKAPSKIITKKQEANKEFGDVMEMVVFISNIRASPEKPFKLIYEGDQVMYQREEDSAAGKTIIVRGEVPKKPKEDTIVSLCVDMPQINIHTQQNFNLSEHGRFIQIQITQEGNRNNIRIKQQHNDSFDTEQQLGDKNDEMSRIYVHYSGIPASEEKPFKLWIGDMLAHQITEPMTKSQSGVLRGAIPKIKRCNPSTESHHDVKLKIHMPMLDPEEKVYIVNLTDNGDHVGIYLDGSKITVRQEKDKVDSDSPILEPVKSKK